YGLLSSSNLTNLTEVLEFYENMGKAFISASVASADVQQQIQGFMRDRDYYLPEVKARIKELKEKKA
ncbi:MAG: hypothetical protein PHS02_02625, partial [Candidatus ainarchaeum sp.]|nr:hypothetical protein [Candidatus ainarchaeum sp.]